MERVLLLVELRKEKALDRLHAMSSDERLFFRNMLQWSY